MLIILVYVCVTMKRQFTAQLSDHLNNWVQNSQSIHADLFTVDNYTTITVNIDILSPEYREKYVYAQPNKYYNRFLEALMPYLSAFLLQYGIKEYTFTFHFMMGGIEDREIYVKAA